MERRTKSATFTGIYLALVVLVLLAVNILSYQKFARFDVTEQERFTLSLGSKRMVCEGLSKDLQVDFYVTRGLAKTDLFIEDVTNLFDEYTKAEYKKADGAKSPPSHFRYTIIEPKTEDEKKAAKEEGLKEQLLAEGSETTDNQATVGSGYLGFVIKYGNEKEVIPFWPPESTQGVEFFISNKIREVRDRAENRKSRYGIITGKDEIKLTDSLVPAGMQPMAIKNVFDEYFPYYEFEDIDLKDGETEIDKDLIGVIITQPKKDYTEKELRRLDEFLMKGDKALVFYVSAININASDKDMKATLNTHGLEKILSGYGVEMKREAAVDFGSAFQVDYPTRMGDRIWFVNPAVPVLQDDDSFDDEDKDPKMAQKGKLLDVAFPTFFRMPQIPFPFPSPLVLHKEAQPDAEFTVVARTSARTSIVTDDTINMRHNSEWRETDPQSQQIVGVSLVGNMKSAFAGKGDDMGIKAQAQAQARVLVISSSQFLANPFARAGNPPPLPPQLQMMGGNQPGDQELTLMAQPYLQSNFILLVTSFKGALDWMANDPDLLAVNAKLLSEPTLNYSMKKPRAEKGDTPDDMKKKYEAFKQERKTLQSTIQWWLIIMPAALIAAFGIVRWRLREANRDKAVF